MKQTDRRVEPETDSTSPRPIPTDPQELARAMFRGVERKIEAKKKELHPHRRGSQD